MTTQGQTVVRIQKLNGKFTSQKNLQIYILNYMAGDARPDISLDTINENYLHTVGLKENGVYLCTWEQIGTRVNPNTGEELPRFAMRFSEIDQTNPLAFAVQLKQFEDVFGNQKSVEEARRSKYRTVTSSTTFKQAESLLVAETPADGEEDLF